MALDTVAVAKANPDAAQPFAGKGIGLTALAVNVNLNGSARSQLIRNGGISTNRYPGDIDVCPVCPGAGTNDGLNQIHCIDRQRVSNLVSHQHDGPLL